MEFLSANPILTALIGLVGVPLVIYFFNLLLPRQKVYLFGYRLGSFIRTFSFEKIGEKQASKILDVICNTLSDLFGGLTDGTTGKTKNIPPAK